MMRKPHTFNLTHTATVLLEELKEKGNTTKTDIVERAILEYAKPSKKKNALLDYAGTISEKTADKMLREIYRHRDSKPIVKI